MSLVNKHHTIIYYSSHFSSWRYKHRPSCYLQQYHLPSFLYQQNLHQMKHTSVLEPLQQDADREAGIITKWAEVSENLHKNLNGDQLRDKISLLLEKNSSQTGQFKRGCLFQIFKILFFFFLYFFSLLFQFVFLLFSYFFLHHSFDYYISFFLFLFPFLLL